MNPMTHDDAVQQLAVEQYLLDELQGEARERFEAHFFDCSACTADLKAGLLFLETAKQEMLSEAPVAARKNVANISASSLGGWLGRLLQPLVLVPALAAALAVIVYQSAVLLPRAQTQLAQARTPSVVESLTLANAGPRGDSASIEVVATPGGAYQLAVDLPPAPAASAYRLTLYDSSGRPVWHTDLSATQEKDSVKLQVPVAATGPGTNLLAVDSLQPDTSTNRLASYKYTLRLQPDMK